MSLISGIIYGRGATTLCVAEHRHGLIVFADSISLEVYSLLGAGAHARGFGWTDVDIACALGAHTVFTRDPETGLAWRAELDLAARRAHPNDPVGAFLASPLGGQSSWTLIELTTGRAHPHKRRPYAARVPADAESFRRCVLAIERCGLDITAAGDDPDWAPLVAHWEDLMTLWRVEDLAGLKAELGTLQPADAPPIVDLDAPEAEQQAQLVAAVERLFVQVEQGG